MAAYVLSIVTLVLGVAMVALVLVRTWVRGDRQRREQAARRLDLTIGALGMALGGALALQAALQLRAGDKAGAAPWLMLVAGGLMTSDG